MLFLAAWRMARIASCLLLAATTFPKDISIKHCTISSIYRTVAHR